MVFAISFGSSGVCAQILNGGFEQFDGADVNARGTELRDDVRKAVYAILGLAFPAIFAVGTTIPLMLFVALFAFGAQSLTPLVRKLRAADVWVSRLAAIIFILVGINEIALYWFN